MRKSKISAVYSYNSTEKRGEIEPDNDHHVEVVYRSRFDDRWHFFTKSFATKKEAEDCAKEKYFFRKIINDGKVVFQTKPTPKTNNRNTKSKWRERWR
jgi:hypothetical protein